jgi:hypothetical protein
MGLVPPFVHVVREPVAFKSDVPLWCSANVLLINVWDQLLNYAQ